MIRLNNAQYFHFLHRADALRRSGSLCDAVISVNNQTFRAHRLVLACASTKLAQSLDQEEPDHQVHCTLEDLSPRTFQQVLDFAYTQTLEVSVDDLQRLLSAAQMLEMRSLEEECQHHLDLLLRKTEKERGGDEEMHEKKKTREEGKIQVSTEDLKSVSTFSRDSVITSSVSNMMSSSPWMFPSHMWSPVSTLRRIAENYSNFIAAQPSAAHTVTLPTSRILHLQGNRYPNTTAAHCSVVTSLHYAQNHYTASARMVSSIEEGLHVRRKKAKLKVDKTTELSCPNVHRADTVTGCTHCSEPVQPESASSSPVEARARCRLFEKDRHSQSNGQDLRGRPYQCLHCPKKFSLKHQLDAHHRVHTGEKPFECRLCGQRSRDFSAMIKHLRTHGGASPYQCTLCLEFCSSLVAMQRHVKSHPLHDFPSDWSISSTYLYTSHTSQHSHKQ
ncbi:zinc finger and BTB domain-containing protein 16 [Dunckerocampus dactyliophorus]|uniref:zinc finger and BTB domain-containing protein 16 n=1 Tax=Dunckerocampus dactyliophorus TaxID=161453 RepID=UPI002407437D|nr:zinc finger and BTB domain-containing protein 16 [Dunckerocampus dactyliophorus]